MKKINLGERFMMFSNIFLILPVLFAAIYHQWLYFFFASGLFIFSPLFHWYQITNRSSTLFQVFKTFDWLFAISAFIYMYYYIYRYTGGISQLSLYFSLSLIVIFFWYGWRRGDYHKWHPWFHIIAPIVSSAILIVAN
jgi:hypothetical protein